MARLKDNEAKSGVRPSDFLDYAAYLNQLYLERKELPGGYSLAKFATDLGMATATMIHQIIKGRRKLTAKAAHKVGTALGIKGPERLYFLKMVDHNNASTPSEREALQADLLLLKGRMAPTPVAKDHLQFVSDWFNPVIRELVALAGAPNDPEGIAHSLVPQIRPEQARKSLELLTRLGMIRLDIKSGRYVPVEGNLWTPDGADDLVYVQFQQSMIDLGKDSINTIDPEERHVTGISIRIRQDQIGYLKELVHQFNMELLGLEASPADADDVYQVNIQLFPLTRLGSKKGASDEAA